METEYIILIKFNSIKEGLDFLNNKDLKIAFIVGETTYNHLGKKITIEGETFQLLPTEIYLDIKPKLLPGNLYVENNLLKYFKEI